MTRPPESSEEVSSVTRLLHAMRDGDESAGHELLELVYGELRGLAGSVFTSQAGEHTLQPTALVHEAWIKMAGNLDSVEGKRHFLSIAAKAMRQVLIDHARSGARQKRGGHRATLTLLGDPAELSGATSGFTVDAAGLHECLNTLARLDERAARVVELRLLGTMTIAEIAQTLGVSARTIDSDWNFARAWLHKNLADE